MPSNMVLLADGIAKMLIEKAVMVARWSKGVVNGFIEGV